MPQGMGAPCCDTVGDEERSPRLTFSLMTFITVKWGKSVERREQGGVEGGLGVRPT